MISTMGDAEGNGKGDFLLIDAEKGIVKGKLYIHCVLYYRSATILYNTFDVKSKITIVMYIISIGTWTNGETAKFGYDFWYQPYWDVLVSSEWGTPKYFKTGFHPEHVNDIGNFI